MTSLISIQYVIIIGNDVARACSDEIGQNLLTRHFLASLHVCDTIEGLRLFRAHDKITFPPARFGLIRPPDWCTNMLCINICMHPSVANAGNK
jgi:hypothetical protein